MRIKLRRRTSALDRIQARRAIACGRAVLLGVDAVPDVVLARMVEHGEPGVTMPPGAVLLEVWGGRPSEILPTVRANTPAGVAVMVICHVAGRFQRLAAWWRVVVHHYHRLRWALRRG